MTRGLSEQPFHFYEGIKERVDSWIASKDKEFLSKEPIFYQENGCVSMVRSNPDASDTIWNVDWRHGGTETTRSTSWCWASCSLMGKVTKGVIESVFESKEHA
ncbi:hypothetical protein NPIL_439071 [Nephila pilipes]|uniref:Uncharacterized protein n=1 Tax=Nephila pilipes TaxID=299642 RepID=A0A8X6QEF4_NEPPI|nr:hypothetical protein NPIL_439071 [Nephila pilipes]